MVYAILFCGLPVVGVVAYAVLCARMAAAATPAPPYGPVVCLFAGYGVLLLLGVSLACGEWSGMHYVAAAGVAVVGTPWLLVQSAVLWPTRFRSAYHRSAVLAGLWFPAGLAAWLAWVAVLVARHTA